MTKHPLANKIEINHAKSIVEKLAYQLVNKILQCDLTMMPLLDISNDWISPDIFPENWIIEIVTPIFKSGKKIIINKLSVNFCTIIFLKISERIMYIQVYNYPNNKNLLFHLVSGSVIQLIMLLLGLLIAYIILLIKRNIYISSFHWFIKSFWYCWL